MLKLGFAVLFVAFFACNFYENSQAEEPEKQGDVVLERGGGSRKASEKDDGGFAVEDDSDYAYDEHPRQDSGKDERSPGVGKRRYTAKCGGKTYNPRWGICCAGVLRSRPSGLPRCCGTRAYDSRWGICCTGVLQSRPSGSSMASCCGTKAYDSRWGICCAGVLQSRPSGSPSCCGTKLYNARRYKCCQGQVKPRC